MLRVLLIILGIYIVYKLVVDFIIPVSKATNRMKQQFNEMQDRVNQFQKQQTKQPEKKETKVGDYIDFEEVK